MSTSVLRQVAAGIALVIAAATTPAFGQVFKCVIGGTTTFQSTPCPSDKPSRYPTKEELVAESKKRQAVAAAKAASSAKQQAALSGPTATAGRTTPGQDQGYKCDGRTYCSQMRSCTEAKFFLANCPNVKMDGNSDGTPCEQQWCTSAFAK
jgi:hypothetical protein